MQIEAMNGQGGSPRDGTVRKEQRQKLAETDG
jgi:hypothetical protein